MPYSDSHEYVFIAVPKTGTTSLISLLQSTHRRVGGSMELAKGRLRQRHHRQLGTTGLPGKRAAWAKHLSAVELAHVMGRSYDEYFRFAFVRNPWARAVSKYHYTRSDVKPSLWERWRVGHQRNFHDLPFDRWVSKLYKRAQRGRKFHMRDKLVDVEGNLAVDFVGRLETLEEDLQAIARRLGLELARPKRKNASPNRKRPYQEYYTDELREMVAEISRVDIETFGYTFEGAEERPDEGPFALPA